MRARRFLPSVKLLLAFDAVVRHGSVTAAAAGLSLTQSNMSRLVQMLEARLGRELFARRHKRLVANAAALACHREIARALDIVQRASMREFFLWLSQQDGFRSRIKPSDAAYFRLSRRDEAEARAAPARPAPSFAQAKRALALMPTDTPRALRDKAVFSLLCLTGVRVGALISLRIKHVNLTEQSVTQNPREVATKFGRSIDTFFARDFEEAEPTLRAWLIHLDEVEFFGPDAPLFPATGLVATPHNGLTAAGFERRHWKSTEPVRKIVRAAFERAGLPNYGPHAFRHMHARHSVNSAASVAEFIATSQNLGHNDPLTTIRYYGQISRKRQRALITGKSSEG